MSSDARIRWQKDGTIRGSHDGDCHSYHTGSKYDLRDIISDIERCLQCVLAWEIHDSGTDDGNDERYYLAGWSAR